MPDNKHIDFKLLIDLQNGSKKAFNDIYNRYWKRLYVHAYKRLNSKTTAEELVQEIFVQLWEKRDKITIEKSLDTYLHGIIKRKILLLFRDKYLHARHHSHISSRAIQADTHLERRIVQKDLLEKIESLIQNLPKQSRRVFELSRKHFLSNREIAEELQVSHKTVEYHIDYALKYLRDRCPDYIPVVFLLLTSLS